MVLHNNKWDRKQNRDRVRKLKAKGKEDPAAAAKDVKEKRSGKAVGVTPAGDKVEEEEEEEGTDSSDGPDDEEEGEEEEEEEEGQKGQFARRKLASNSWRYEKAAAVGDSLLDPAAQTRAAEGEGKEEEEEEHEDYVALTLARKGGQWVDAQAEKIRSGAVDEAFLRESWAPGRTKQPLLASLPKRGNIVKVDRRDFVDVTENIAKRNNADAFRARFDGGGGQGKKRTPRVLAGDPGGSGDGGSGDDLDAFLGALELDPKLATARGGTGAGDKAAAARSRAIRPAVAAEAGTGDEWLDQMLGGR